jgi:hypothetical protein
VEDLISRAQCLDYVRLNAGLAPPHWKRSSQGKWDAGYEATGYFLQWIEVQYGSGSIRKLNMLMKGKDYDEAAVFGEVVGLTVDELWKVYCATSEGDS